MFESVGAGIEASDWHKMCIWLLQSNLDVLLPSLSKHNSRVSLNRKKKKRKVNIEIIKSVLWLKQKAQKLKRHMVRDKSFQNCSQDYLVGRYTKTIGRQKFHRCIPGTAGFERKHAMPEVLFAKSILSCIMAWSSSLKNHGLALSVQVSDELWET